MTVPLRILLLEDSENDADLIKECLRADRFIFELIRAETRAEFLAALETQKIDLILSDHKLPSFDGFSALKLAQSMCPDLPFIFVSGTLGEDLAVEALKIGATDYVLKTRLSRLGPSAGRALREAEERAERKKAEEALRKMHADLAHATRVAILGELTATIAHEVNQPLAAVVSSGNACLRWLASEPPNIENAKQSVDRIIRDAHRASEVIGRVRSLAKKTPPEKQWLNINDAVRETLSLTRMEAAEHGASLRSQLSDDVPPVWADRIEVQQVILNLIINGIEAISAEGNERRDVLVTTKKDKPDDILLTVCDTGTGLDPAKLEHIFDAFYSTKREGMGLGLAVSRSIIEAHGGRLWASQNEPHGAIFQFTLPIARKEAP
jgi:C4-dicarboxylate-specific signal transduction histidine kinase